MTVVLCFNCLLICFFWQEAGHYPPRSPKPDVSPALASAPATPATPKAAAPGLPVGATGSAAGPSFLSIAFRHSMEGAVEYPRLKWHKQQIKKIKTHHWTDAQWWDCLKPNWSSTQTFCIAVTFQFQL